MRGLLIKRKPNNRGSIHRDRTTTHTIQSGEGFKDKLSELFSKGQNAVKQLVDISS